MWNPAAYAPIKKEAERIRIPPDVPTPRTIGKWRMSMRQEIVAVSHDATGAMEWIMQVVRPETTFDSLALSGRFASLDAKIASALMMAAVCKGEVGWSMQRESARAAQRGALVTGRQCLWLIYDHYRLDNRSGGAYCITDLMAVTLRGNAIGEFVADWEQVLYSTPQHAQIPDDVKASFFCLRRCETASSCGLTSSTSSVCPTRTATATTSSSSAE
jgi:hypothetical protein